jgi:predicted dehydrogenase
MSLSRRRFLAHCGGALGASVFPSVAPRNVLGANRRLNLAGIGVGGQGWTDITVCASENMVALCDVDELRLSQAGERFPAAHRFSDFRVMLDRLEREIDAVIVSTPDHTHFPAALRAIKRRKPVFCQAPLAHTVWEARELARAARQAKVATQMGNQGISHFRLRRDAELIRGGVIGSVREVHCWTDRPGKWWKQGLTRPSETPPAPEHLNWDLWLGSAPYRPYHPAYAPNAWRGWWDFGTGALGDMGCHLLNLATLALDLRDPVSVAGHSEGGTTESGPVSSEVVWEFPARGRQKSFQLFWYDGGRKPAAELVKRASAAELPDSGVILVGEKDTLLVDGSNGGGRFLSGGTAEDYRSVPQLFPKDPDWERCHYTEWLAACKGGPPALANFEVSGPLTEIVLLGSVALRTGERLQWDARRLRVSNTQSAAPLLRTAYRSGWEV